MPAVWGFNMPERIQLSRKKGWRLQPNTVVVSRPSKWGNPFKGKQSTAVFLYESAIEHGLSSVPCVHEIQKLRGKNLACWCALDTPCHADVLLKIANKI